MRKDIKNVEPVQPIRHKPRVSNHKTFGENIIHGDFTFNNHDYDQANWLVRIFGIVGLFICFIALGLCVLLSIVLIKSKTQITQLKKVQK